MVEMDTAQSNIQQNPESLSDRGQHQPEARREFFKKALTSVIGAAAGLLPLVVGVLFFLDPVRRKRFVPLRRRNNGPRGVDDDFVRVTTLDALPPDGRPQKFTVIADRSDAWNYFADQRIGNVFLRRISADQVIAFTEICPHLGCSVDYKPNAPQERAFQCPCHNSAFAITGEKTNEIPPRDLDRLEAVVRGGEVWVRYQTYRIGTEEKTPTS